MRVGDFFQFERSFPRNRVMYAPAQVQKLLRLEVFLGVFLRLLVPCRKLLLDGVWKLHQTLQVGSGYLRGHPTPLSSQEERHQVQHCQLRCEALGCWHRQFPAGAGD